MKKIVNVLLVVVVICVFFSLLMYAFDCDPDNGVIAVTCGSGGIGGYFHYILALFGIIL